MDHRSAIETTAVERYFLDEMSAEERAEFETHFFDCEHCAAAIRVMSSLEANARAEFEARRPLTRAVEPQSAPKPSGPGFWERYFNWLRPAIAAPALATLLVVMGYQTLQPARTHDFAGPQAATSLLLRGETRGTEPVVSVPADHSLVLTLDLAGVSRQSGYSLEIHPESGDILPAIRVPAPSAGEPLTLALAGGTLTPGHYDVTLRSDAGGAALVHYRFRVHP